jgi:hypothetical protein
MDTLDKNISNALNEAIVASKIIGHFQYGHNVFQSPVQINEIFSMLDTVIDKVLDAIDDVIPDINLAPYADGKVDPTRANLCWIELKKDYYGLMLNTHKGIKYRPFSDEDIQNLLLNGQVSSWFLVSKIQNLAYLLATDDDKTITVKYFKSLIIGIIERFFDAHENDKDYHPAGEVSFENLDSIISRLQIQNTKPAIVPSNDDKGSDANWSQSIITTPIHQICWQSASNFRLYFMRHTDALKIISSTYLNNRSDVEVFLESTYKKFRGSSTVPNEFCFLASNRLNVPYVDLNYVVESQLQGYLEVEYESGEREKIYPDTQPVVINKGKNDISFIVVVKLDNNITKKVKRVIMETADGISYLPNLKLACSFTGISEYK